MVHSCFSISIVFVKKQVYVGNEAKVMIWVDDSAIFIIGEKFVQFGWEYALPC